MLRELIEGHEYTSGYHGTDLVTAHMLFAEGFRQDIYGTDFAPADNYDLAKAHGRINALRPHMGQFAVLAVDFNQIGHIMSEYGNVRFYGDELAPLIIQHMDVYRLGESEPYDKLTQTVSKSS